MRDGAVVVQSGAVLLPPSLLRRPCGWGAGGGGGAVRVFWFPRCTYVYRPASPPLSPPPPLPFRVFPVCNLGNAISLLAFATYLVLGVPYFGAKSFKLKQFFYNQNYIGVSEGI